MTSEDSNKIYLSNLKNDLIYDTPTKKRNRGYDFERYLFEKFENESIGTKKPFKNRGEQIDGGIYLDGSWYLIEAKWHTDPLPVSEIYSFKGKVDGKLTGTKGFFISWSGYSKECADALRFGKELNILLCDSSDIERADTNGWLSVFREKLMYAALYGEAYTPNTMLLSIKNQEITHHPVEIFVEGNSDAEIISSIMNFMSFDSSYSIIPCSGKISAIKMASSLPKTTTTKRLLILDSDGNQNQTADLEKLPLIDKVISIDPGIEALFYPDSDSPRKEFQTNARQKRQSLTDHARSLLSQVLKRDPQKFISNLRESMIN